MDYSRVKWVAIATAVFKIIEAHLKFGKIFNFSYCFNFFKHKMAHLSIYHIFKSKYISGRKQIPFTLMKLIENEI